MADLQTHIEGALADYLRENGGGMVTAWHFVADLIDGDGDQSWLYSTPEDQRQISTMGLIEWARGVAQHEQRSYLDDLDEADD